MPDVVPPVHPMTVDPENVTVICARHRRRVAADPEGPSPVIHVASDIPPPCDSQQFIIQRREIAAREDAIPVLTARAEAMAERRRSLRHSPADHGSAGGQMAAEEPAR